MLKVKQVCLYHLLANTDNLAKRNNLAESL